MVVRIRTVRWRDRTYSFQRLETAESSEGAIAEEWAVSRGGEFIGMLQCAAELSEHDFELRCLQWLTDLLGRRGEPSQRAGSAAVPIGSGSDQEPDSHEH